MNWKQKISYFLIITTYRIIALFPLKVLFLFAESITFFVYHVIGYRRKVVFENLHNSFPEKTDKEIAFIARKYFRHLSIMVVENIHLRFASVKKIHKRIIIDKKEVFDDLFKQGKSAIVMLGHMGNWEFGGCLAPFISQPIIGVYKKLSSVIFDKIYFDIRSNFGVIPVEMKVLGRKIMEISKGKTPHLIYMVADQSPPANESKHWIKFLNQDTNIFIGSEKLAKKFNMPVVYLEISRHKKGVYRVVPQLITMKPKETEELEITKCFFQLLEESIKQHPRYWLWSHRRWKHKKTIAE